MLRKNALTDKILLLGVDGMDPRFTRYLVDQGKLPNVQKLMDRGSCRDDLMLLGANPTITPPMWATLATGAYPMTHGIIDYNLTPEMNHSITMPAFSSAFLKAEPIFNITAEAGIKTLVMHWPGGSYPPSIDSENLITIDGSSPGAVCSFASSRDFDMVYVASTKCQKPQYMPYSTTRSDLKGDEQLAPLVRYARTPKSDESKAELKKAKEYYLETTHDVDSNLVFNNLLFEEDEGLNWSLGEWPSSACLSPVFPPQDWGFTVPEGALEFVMITYFGKVIRHALILKNADGKYDKVAVYKSKDVDEPLVVLEKDVFTPYYDTVPDKKGHEEKVYRNIRLLELADDGSYVRIWASRGMSLEDDSVFFPKSFFQELIDVAGPIQPTSQMSANDADLIMKCNLPQWIKSAEWQSKVLHYMIENHGVKAIFSHFHNVDLMSHNYIKFLKKRDNSRYEEDEVMKFAEATYKVTDDYIGSFLHLLDEGWSIVLFSDHGLVCSEEGPHVLCENVGVCVDPMREFGYTVLKKDENGQDIPEIDWDKTKAIQVGSNSIWINLKGRDPHGIVDPDDKYELEEQIITDLYGYRDQATGKRIVALALHNKDAILLGLGGPDGSDIVLFLNEAHAEEHGTGLSTAQGYAHTSLSPIFIAAGPGIKEGYRTTRYIREVDVAPTAAVLIGVDMPDKCEGAPAYQIFTEKL